MISDEVCIDLGARVTILGVLDRGFWLAIDTEMAPSFPWFAPIETLQGEQDLTGLAPEGSLVAAQPVKRIGRQVCEADKGACEIAGLISSVRSRQRPSIPARFLLQVVLGRHRILVHAVDDILLLLISPSALPELK